jgi:hypothetical protein
MEETIKYSAVINHAKGRQVNIYLDPDTLIKLEHITAKSKVSKTKLIRSVIQILYNDMEQNNVANSETSTRSIK